MLLPSSSGSERKNDMKLTYDSACKFDPCAHSELN